MIVDFFASLSFYLIPYLIGRFFTKSIILSWLAGALSLFIIFFGSAQIAILLKINFSLLVSIIMVGLSLISFIQLSLDIAKKPKSFTKLNPGIIFMLIFSSLVYFLIWKRNTPYPLVLNWDIYEHLTLANLIAAGKLSLLTTKISDTFTLNSYSPIFHILLSVPKIIFQKNLLGIYWWLEYWQYLLTIIASFLLARKISGNKLTAFLSALISGLVFESSVAYSPLFLIPQTLVALLTVFLITELKNIKLKFFLLSALVIFLLHYIVGILCIFVLGIIYWAQKKQLKRPNLLILASFLISLALILLNLKAKWEVLRIEEAQHFNFPLWQKLGFFADWYGIGLAICFIIGFISIVRSNELDKKIILIVGLLILGLSLAPFSYFLKFYVLGGYFINFVLALGLSVLLSNLPRIWKILGFFWVTIFLILTFYKNQLIYKEPLHFNNFETQLSFQEIEAGKWLAQNSKAGVFLISDPGTQYILEALSGVNTQGGAYMSLKTRQKLISINSSHDPVFIKGKLLKIKDELETSSGRDALFVVGGRYFAWQDLSGKEKESFFYNIWSPKLINPQDENFINLLSRSLDFKLIYRNNELCVFKII
jgi:hypothetical protein